jgi:hypothetical protein
MANLGRRKSDSPQPSTADDSAPPNTHQLRIRAYELYQQRGGEGDWDEGFQAKSDLNVPHEDDEAASNANPKDA